MPKPVFCRAWLGEYREQEGLVASSSASDYNILTNEMPMMFSSKYSSKGHSFLYVATQKISTSSKEFIVMD